MEINNLNNQIAQGREEFVEETIQIGRKGMFLSELYFENITKLHFHQCDFIGSYLEFESINKPEIPIIFNDCTFEIDLKFDNCSFKKIQFLNTKKIKKINVVGGEFGSVYFRNNNFKEKTENILNGNLLFSALTIKENAGFDYINLIEGTFDFHENLILENNILETNFEYSTFNNAGFLNNNFLNEVSFKEMQIINECRFDDCEFQKSNFSQLRIGVKRLAEINFYECKFLRTSIFHYIYGDVFGKLSFESCLFEKYVQFNSSKLYKLELNNVQFNAYVSFQDVFIDATMSIENIVFEKQANFDNIQIKKIDECDRKSIRTIKLQLQKAENKIDFNRFRVYEFNAYRKDIKKKLVEFEKDKNRFYHRGRQPIQLKRDLFVLWISDIVSEYGTDWKRALKFTLLFGFLFFSIFFVIENYQYSLCFANYKDFISGLFRFFLVTDFYNPLVNNRIYLTNPISWFVFILGKIVIAFGIFEMIQSFRKFKA